MNQLRIIFLVLMVFTISSVVGYENGIEIRTESPGVKVYLNNKYIDITKEIFDMNILRIENIKPGSYILRCELAGVSTYKVTVIVKSDEILIQNVIFEQEKVNTGTIKVLSKPSQAKVLLDGKIIGTSDLIVEDVSSGIKRIEVCFDRKEPDQNLSISFGLLKNQNITIIADFFEHKISIDAKYTVAFNSTPKGILYIDNKKIGLCPIKKILKSGMFDIEVRLEGYLPHKEQIIVLNNSVIDIELSPLPIHAYLEVEQDSAVGSELVFVNDLYVGETPLKLSKVEVTKGKTSVKIGETVKQLRLSKNSKYRIIPNNKYAYLTLSDIQVLSSFIELPIQPVYFPEDSLINKKLIIDEEGGEPLYLGGIYIGGVLLCANLLCFINPPQEWNTIKQEYQDSNNPSVKQYLLGSGISAGLFYWAFYHNEEITIENPPNIAKNKLLKANWEKEKSRVNAKNNDLLKNENAQIDKKNKSRGEWQIVEL